MGEVKTEPSHEMGVQMSAIVSMKWNMNSPKGKMSNNVEAKSGNQKVDPTEEDKISKGRFAGYSSSLCSSSQERVSRWLSCGPSNFPIGSLGHCFWPTDILAKISGFV